MDAFYREYLDQVIDRRGTDCLKWDKLERYFGRPDLQAAWVADMDFRTAPEVIGALTKRAETGIYGYTDSDSAERKAVAGWLQRRHHLTVPEEWIEYSPGVIDTLFFCMRAMTRPGDKVMIQTPAYMPFYDAVRLFGCTLVRNPLIEVDGRWQLDFEDMEAKFREGVKLMIFCNPHKPVGRVWTREEMEKVAELCHRYGVQLISDEIHADFALGGCHTTRVLAVPHTEKAVMLMSATKSFNLAGLRHSTWVTPDDELRGAIHAEIEKAHQTMPNLFGSIAQTTACSRGDAWMDAVLEYITENRDYVSAFAQERLPGVKAPKQEGTYLMWVDFRGTGMSHEQVKAMLLDRAGVALNDGTDFGEEGRGFFRLNLAAPRSRIERIMTNIERALKG